MFDITKALNEQHEKAKGQPTPVDSIVDYLEGRRSVYVKGLGWLNPPAKEKAQLNPLEQQVLEIMKKAQASPQHTTKDIKPTWQHMTTTNGESFLYIEKAKRPGDRTMIDIFSEHLEDAELEPGWPLAGLQEALKKLTTTRRRSRLDNH